MLQQKLSETANALVSKSQECTSLQRELVEVRAKAQKYERLEQVFTTTQREPVDSLFRQTQSSCPDPTTTRGTYQAQNTSTLVSSQPTGRNHSSSVSITINPAQTKLVSSASPDNGLSQNLYTSPSPAPPASKPRKAGTNDAPSGAPHGLSQWVDSNFKNSILKRKEPEELRGNLRKRPQVDAGQVSDPVHVPLAGTRGSGNRYQTEQVQPKTLSYNSLNGQDPRPFATKPGSQTSLNPLLLGPDSTTAPVPFPREGVAAPKVQPAQPVFQTQNIPIGSGQSHPPVAATQNLEGQPAPVSVTLSGALTKALSFFSVMVKTYPIALWTGSTNPNKDTPKGLVTTGIPSDLVNFLSDGLTMHLNMSNVNRWNSMTPNRGTCILNRLVEYHQVPHHPQPRRTCGKCSPRTPHQQRPCALLQDVNGVPTLVFMPLHDMVRVGARWCERRFWVMGG